MTQSIEPSTSFLYQAQTLDGQPITGTIDAGSVEQAQRLLADLRLRVLNIESTAARAISSKPLRSEDFIAFNQQLAHLTSAGMPIEQGLRLIAQDMQQSRLAGTIRELAAEMERGTPLEQAFEKQQDRFPPLYSKLIGAGVASGNLPGMLLNLGRHMELTQRLRAALWRSFAYPIMVLICIGIIIVFLSVRIIPQFGVIFRDFGTKLPALTEAIMMLPVIIPWLLAALAIVVVALILIWALLKSMGRDRAIVEKIALHLPLVGPILRYNLLARWCDAVGLSVSGGLDLPRAIALADDAVASPGLGRDGDAMIAALQSGQPLETFQHPRLIPATVIASMALASKQNDLPVALNTLSEMYQQQAQLRLSLLPGLLTPILIVLIASIIGTIILGMFLPFLVLLHVITG